MGLFKKIGLFIASAKGWWAAWLSIPGGVAAVTGVMEGVSTPHLVLITMCVLAVSSAFSKWSIEGYDYVVRYRGNVRDRLEAAERLNQMYQTGTEKLTIGEVAAIWAGDHASKIWVFNPRLRKLKRAVSDKKITAHYPKPGLPREINSKTVISINDVIDLLEKGEI